MVTAPAVGDRYRIAAPGEWVDGMAARVLEPAIQHDRVLLVLPDGYAFAARREDLVERLCRHVNLPWLGDPVVAPHQGTIVKMTAGGALVECQRTNTIGGPWSFLLPLTHPDAEDPPVVEFVPWRDLVRTGTWKHDRMRERQEAA